MEEKRIGFREVLAFDIENVQLSVCAGYQNEEYNQFDS